MTTAKRPSHRAVLQSLFYEHANEFHDELAAGLVHHIVREAAHEHGHDRTCRENSGWDGHLRHDAIAASELWVNLPVSSPVRRRDMRDQLLIRTRAALLPYMVSPIGRSDRLTDDEEAKVGAALMDWSCTVAIERTALFEVLREELSNVGTSAAASLWKLLSEHEVIVPELHRLIAHAVIRNADVKLLRRIFSNAQTECG